MARTVRQADNYLSKVLKYIPSEIIMAFVAIEGVLRSSYRENSPLFQDILWYVTIALLIIAPLWLWRVMGVTSIKQLFLSTLALLVWLFAMGGPFRFLDWYKPALGSVALPIYTLLVPIVICKTGR